MLKMRMSSICVPILSACCLAVCSDSYARDCAHLAVPNGLEDALAVQTESSRALEEKMNGRESFSNGEGRYGELAAARKANERCQYLAEYEDAITLEKIRAFEKKYAGNDPEDLIKKLGPDKERLLQQRYLEVYSGADTSEKLEAFLAEYASNDPNGLVVEAKKRLPLLKRQEAAAALQLEKDRQKEIQQKDLAEKRLRADEDKKRLQFISSLRSKYAKNIISHSVQAYEVVSGFHINCRLPDRRVLPLMHVLFASAKSIESVDSEMRFHLQSRGASVRIFGQGFQNGKPLTDPLLYYEINEWGELRPVAVRSEALLNACVGFQGPIWLMPGEPGY